MHINPAIHRCGELFRGKHNETIAGVFNLIQGVKENIPEKVTFQLRREDKADEEQKVWALFQTGCHAHKPHVHRTENQEDWYDVFGLQTASRDRKSSASVL